MIDKAKGAAARGLSTDEIAERVSKIDPARRDEAARLVREDLTDKAVGASAMVALVFNELTRETVVAPCAALRSARRASSSSKWRAPEKDSGWAH